MAAPTNGELLERARYAEAELANVRDQLDACHADETPSAREAELEGLCAGLTRQLEASQREAVDLREQLDNLPTFELVETTPPAELAALATAAEAIGTRIAAELESLSPGEVLELADAAARIAGAHQALTPRPLPALR